MKNTGHQPRKRFGQNFLHDDRIISRLVSAINPKADDLMVEIGPGQAALTTPLLDKLNQLHAVELDRDLYPFLRAGLEPRGLTLHEADALKFDFTTLMTDDRPLRVVGNLPYNISTPLLFHLLAYKERIADMHFMLQLEVIERLAATPGNKNYGRLSVIAQYYCQVDKLFHVPPGAFNPPPKVMSAIVRLAPRKLSVEAENPVLLEKVVKISFAQRRKTLRNNLKQLLSAEQLEQLTQDLTLRPEQLSVEDYVKLSNQIASFNDASLL
ncbi:Ribosomal RNA small subunit methyltransferase A [BD1-7 clade bacterium]|uniref:Ribosomal RNA small subunit methyltransferase A n=1 Tax=BD1-7 clade bacterium TaxID=2029982 RepID=A0A5S9QZ33_9GAMM|nr:Ribosomal RNA small subunit methyltransferase A [BD1-7 clade bacterium]